MPGTYREVVCILASKPPITLYGTGTDASQTVIVNNNYNGKAKAAGTPANPCNPSASSTTYGTSGSATFAAYAKDFQAKNITFSNDFDETGMTSNVQAVALMTNADKLVFDGVRVLGNQDTLYMKTPDNTISRAYFKGCYVEGDVDFIFGAATAVLDGCEIKYVSNRRGPTGTGDALSPSTDVRNPYGILVNGGSFTADAATMAAKVALGRAWDDGQVDVPTYTSKVATGIYPNGQALVRDATLGMHVNAAVPWQAAATTSRPFSSTPTDTLPANRLWELNNTGP